jgi:hypothetical protein
MFLIVSRDEWLMRIHGQPGGYLTRKAAEGEALKIRDPSLKELLVIKVISSVYAQDGQSYLTRED